MGKIKEDYLNKLIDDYKLRLSKYHKINIIELKDSNMENEGDLILKSIKEKDFVVTLEILGNKIDSVEFSKSIDNWLMNHGNIDFVIGGSNGLDERVKRRSNYALSFSELTFPHGLFRGILLEQIYRAFKILNNETYHK